MPLYEYSCRECGLRFERRQRFSDDPVTICPECGGWLQVRTGKVRCLHCGQRASAALTICPHCGEATG